MTGDGLPSWEFEHPNRFTAGAVGEPGARVFFFQVFADGTEVNLKCEKQQVVALADHLVKMLDDLPAAAGDDEVAPSESLPPSDVAWVVGSISIGVDRANERLVVLFEEVLLDDDEAITPAPGRLRVHLSAAQVRGFARQAEELSSHSRPLCRLCEQPIDPSGHACPRLN